MICIYYLVLEISSHYLARHGALSQPYIDLTLIVLTLN